MVLWDDPIKEMQQFKKMIILIDFGESSFSSDLYSFYVKNALSLFETKIYTIVKLTKNFDQCSKLN